MNQKIILNPEVLSQFYIPEKLLHRDKEQAQLLKNLVSTFICGSCGSGKTTLAKRVISDFNSPKKGYAVYVDCSLYHITYSILKEILPRSASPILSICSGPIISICG